MRGYPKGGREGVRAGADFIRSENALAVQDLTRLENIKREDPGAIAQAAIDRAVDRDSAADAVLRNALEELRIAETGARAEGIAAKEAEIASIEAAVNAAEDALSYAYLRAPFDGTIVANMSRISRMSTPSSRSSGCWTLRKSR